MKKEKIVVIALEGFCLGKGKDVFKGDKFGLEEWEFRLYQMQGRVKPYEGSAEQAADKAKKGGK